MATYYIESEAKLYPDEIYDGLDSKEKKEILSLLFGDFELIAEKQLAEDNVSVSQFEFQQAIKKLVLNYHNLSQHEENFIINTANKY